MKCLSTRVSPSGLKRRRYERDDGSRFSTVEVPAEVWDSLNREGRGRDRIAAKARVNARQALKELVRMDAARGVKAIASAHELGVPVRTVQRWRKAAK